MTEPLDRLPGLDVFAVLVDSTGTEVSPRVPVEPGTLTFLPYDVDGPRLVHGEVRTVDGDHVVVVFQVAGRPIPLWTRGSSVAITWPPQEAAA